MAQKKKKEYWYVLVMSNNGAVFVTETNNWERTARWDKDKKPMAFTKSDAQFLSMALTMNGHLAYAVGDTWEHDTQPYRYEVGSFYWRKKKEKKCS